jgi:hypothetical protein
MPLLLDADLQVEAMYFDPHASTEEHATDHPILFEVAFVPLSITHVVWFALVVSRTKTFGMVSSFACALAGLRLRG